MKKTILYTTAILVFFTIMQGRAFAGIFIDYVETKKGVLCDSAVRKDFKTSDHICCDVSFYSDVETEVTVINMITDVTGSVIDMSASSRTVSSDKVFTSLANGYIFQRTPGTYFCSALILSANGYALAPSAFGFIVE